MPDVPDHPSPQTRTAVTARITAHVTQGWPHLGIPDVTHRGQFCYVAARLPGHRQPQPILRLRYQGSADRWAIGIYLASDQRYTEAELPTSFGPKTGTLRASTTPSSSTPAPAASPDTSHDRRANCETQACTSFSE